MSTESPSSGDADRPHVVHEVNIALDEKQLKATFYVDDGTIVTIIDDKIYRCALGTVPASDTVRALLLEVGMSNQT